MESPPAVHVPVEACVGPDLRRDDVEDVTIGLPNQNVMPAQAGIQKTSESGH
jgi:hypothetical protein